MPPTPPSTPLTGTAVPSPATSTPNTPNLGPNPGQFVPPIIGANGDLLFPMTYGFGQFATGLANPPPSGNPPSSLPNAPGMFMFPPASHGSSSEGLIEQQIAMLQAQLAQLQMINTGAPATATSFSAQPTQVVASAASSAPGVPSSVPPGLQVVGAAASSASVRDGATGGLSSSDIPPVEQKSPQVEEKPMPSANAAGNRSAEMNSGQLRQRRPVSSGDPEVDRRRELMRQRYNQIYGSNDSKQE